MRLMTLLVAAAICAPALANAQPPRKKTTKTTTAAPAAEAAPATPPPKHHRESLHDQLTGQGYGVAGCGLGSIVFGPKPGPIQIVAATLNAIGYQTFAISTGTSNCDVPQMGQQAAVFIEVNRQILAKDAARGQGETVEGLAAILNCDNAEALGQGLQSNFETIFKRENNSYDATRAILSTIKSNPALQSSCHVG
jgi:hypothetical protein